MWIFCSPGASAPQTMGFEMVMTRNEPIVAQKPIALHRNIMLRLEKMAELQRVLIGDLLIFARGRLSGKLESLRGAVIPADHRRINKAIRAAAHCVGWNPMYVGEVASAITHVNREARRHKAKRAAAKKSGGDKKPASKDPPSLGSSG